MLIINNQLLTIILTLGVTDVLNWGFNLNYPLHYSALNKLILYLSYIVPIFVVVQYFFSFLNSSTNKTC